MTRSVLLFALCLGWCNKALAESTILPIYNDANGEGFFSNAAPDATSTADGNPGTTLGEQRQWAFERALEFWARRLDSGVTITVDAEMNDLFCDSTGAVLGSAGPNSISTDWVPAAGGNAPPFPNIWYATPLANRIANTDLDIARSDIDTEFNTRIDESDCLGSTSWYYALGSEPSGKVSFFKTVVHEIAHGVNFLTFVNLANGERLGDGSPGFPEQDDVYMKFLEDHSLGLTWPDMTDQQRADSAIDTNDLHWTGPNVIAVLASLGNGTSGGHVEMFSPGMLSPGSSVSHWDTDVDDTVANDEIMEPNATGTEKLTVTDELLHDLGWNDISAMNCTFPDDRLTQTGIYNGINTHNACVSVTYDGAQVTTGDTSATAGQQIVLKNGFSVQDGASLLLTTNPNTGL